MLSYLSVGRDLVEIELSSTAAYPPTIELLLLLPTRCGPSYPVIQFSDGMALKIFLSGPWIH